MKGTSETQVHELTGTTPNHIQNKFLWKHLLDLMLNNIPFLFMIDEK